MKNDRSNLRSACFYNNVHDVRFLKFYKVLIIRVIVLCNEPIEYYSKKYQNY